MSQLKDWRVDSAPIAFFALLIAAKTYALVVYVQSNGEFFNLLLDSQTRAAAGPFAEYYLTSQFSYLGYYLTALAFDCLVLYSFIVRGRAKERPSGLMEHVYPLITVFVPVLGYTLMFMPEVRQLLPPYPPAFFEQLAKLGPMAPFYLDLAGFTLGFIGAAFSIWSIAHLRASFGLRPAVRELITTGPYRRIRHPLYLGEIVHIFGLAVLSATPVGLALFVVAVALQIGRAKLEERKFLLNVPDYAEFRRNTGFLWPKLF